MGGARQVGRDLSANLRIRQLFRRAEQPVARIAHDNVDPPHSGKHRIHDCPDPNTVHQVERSDDEALPMLRLQLIESPRTSDSRNDPISPGQQLLSHEPPQARRCASYQPSLHGPPPAIEAQYGSEPLVREAGYHRMAW